MAGGVALGVIMLPIVALTTNEALKLVPNSYRLGSAGLGAGRFQTIFRIVIPNALPAITTGVLLAVARAAGETAPLIFTALSSQFWPDWSSAPDWFNNNPTPSLSVYIYEFSTSSLRKKTSWLGQLP
jgi:phosphate transport system permease protein